MFHPTVWVGTLLPPCRGVDSRHTGRPLTRWPRLSCHGAGRSSQSAASVYSHPPASRHGSCSRATQTAAVRGIAGRERMANRPDQGYIWARSMYRLRRKGCQLSTILRSYWLDKLALRHVIGQLRCAVAHLHIRQIWDNSNSINVQGPGEHWLATSPPSTQPDTTCYTKVVNFQSRL